MDRDYAQPLDVPAMASKALMSPAHFSREFKAAYGETPYAYLMTRRIERARVASGFQTCGDLAAARDIDQSTVWRWENGGQKPRAPELWRLAKLLGVSPEYLLFGSKGAA